MAAALITALGVSLIGLVISIISGHTAAGADEVFRHATLAVFVTLITLLSHSMTMFYLIGKGKAIREAVTEGQLSQQFVAEISRVRRPVFSIGTLAIGATMLTAIIGGGVDTGAVPTGVHVFLAYSAVAANAAALRAEIAALSASSRVVAAVNRLLERPRQP